MPTGAYLVRLRGAFDARVFVSASSSALKLAARQELCQLFAGAGFKSPALLLPAGLEAAKA
jgi:ribonuclease P protein component